MNTRGRGMWIRTVVVVMVVTTTGCGGGGSDVDEVFAKVMQRPDIEQAVASYTEMTTKIRERLATEMGRTWEQVSDGSRARCGDEYMTGCHLAAEAHQRGTPKAARG